MDRVEKRLDATLKIVQTGMKMLVKMEQQNREFRKETREFAAETREFAAETREFKKETREAIHALIESQMRTDAIVTALGIKIDRFVDGFKAGGNGSGGGRR